EWRQIGGVDEAPVLVAAETLINQNRPDIALEALGSERQGTRARQLRALALDTNGLRGEAIRILEQLRREGALDSETGGLLAGRYKARWLQSHDAASREASFQLYLETYQRTGDSF